MKADELAHSLTQASEIILSIRDQLVAMGGKSLRWPAITKRDGISFIVTDRHVAELKRAFPKVDVEAEVHAAAAYANDPPKGKRRPQSIMQFLRNWMKKAPETAGDPWAGLRSKGEK